MRAMRLKLALILASSTALQPPHVVVVGGGVGGLATASRLAKRGARVTVLEKNDKVGGRVGEYAWQQHRWETGASLLLLPDVYRDALEAAGAAQLDIKRVAPAYAVWYEQHADRGPVILGGDGSELVETARWLAAQPNVDFTKRQRQGHTALHKAAWGGHVALLRYLRDDHGLWDDTPDHAGNFAADLARMANTDRHARAATVLREECSSARAHSCAVLDVDVTATRDDIRRAYLAKARLVHPDRNQRTEGCASDSPSASDRPCDFQTLQRAYQHLTLENGVGTQCNPAHSIKLWPCLVLM